MAISNKFTTCSGCSALVPDIDGPIHPYIGAAPGCWAVYGEVLAREYEESRYPSVLRLMVDTYAAQHPGSPSRQSIQSIAIHLISLYLMLEHGFDSNQATEAINRALRHRERFVWLEPPASMGAITIFDVQKAKSLREHERRVKKWAESVWEAWSLHRDTIRQWAAR
jgi:hypothetical protein